MLNEPRDRGNKHCHLQTVSRNGQEVCEGPAVSRASFMGRMVAFRAQSISFTLIAIGLAISIYHLWRHCSAGRTTGWQGHRCLPGRVRCGL